MKVLGEAIRDVDVDVGYIIAAHQPVAWATQGEHSDENHLPTELVRADTDTRLAQSLSSVRCEGRHAFARRSPTTPQSADALGRGCGRRRRTVLYVLVSSSITNHRQLR